MSVERRKRPLWVRTGRSVDLRWMLAHSQNRKCREIWNPEAKCTHFRRAKGGPVVLFNRCRACRAVVVERAGRGGARKSQTFAVAGGSYVPLAGPGVPVQARIVTEKPCG